MAATPYGVAAILCLSSERVDGDLLLVEQSGCSKMNEAWAAATALQTVGSNGYDGFRIVRVQA
jgi:hypothetical protein